MASTKVSGDQEYVYKNAIKSKCFQGIKWFQDLFHLFSLCQAFATIMPLVYFKRCKQMMDENEK